MKKKWGTWLIALSCVTSVVPGTANANEAPIKNVIILMTDGTSSTHTTAARWYKGSALQLDEMVTGGVRTYDAYSLITDSAPAATAFATGHKSNTKLIGILPPKTTIPGLEKVSESLKFKPVASVLEGARLAGKSTGLIATSNIQHASPAGFSAHWPNRNDYNEIAEQQVYENIDVVLGAGLDYLVPKEQGGKRTDGENMVDVLKSKGYEFVTTAETMKKSQATKLWGLFGSNDLAYEMDREEFHPEQPSLSEMTVKAISTLSKNDKGFFLFVEGSKVDWASHANDPVGVISDVLAFDDAVKVAVDFAKKDGHTLVLAFSDHGNGGMTIGNQNTNNNYDKLPYEAVFNPLKKATVTGEGIEFYLNGQLSEENVRGVMANFFGINDLTAEEVASIQHAKKGQMNYVVGPIISKRANIGWTTNGHTGEDLFLYAYGPNRPIGLIDNTDIAKITAKSLGFDLDQMDKNLFCEASSLFAPLGATIRIDQSDKTNGVLIVEKNGKKAEIPFSKNMIRINHKVYEMKGITVYVPHSGQVFLPREAAQIIKENL